MVVRIRLARSNGSELKSQKSRHFVLAFAALLQPAAVMAGVLAFWRFGADLQWTREFAISNGLLSHWQVWFAIFVVLQGSVILLNRFGRSVPKAPASEPTTGETASALLKSRL